MIWRGAEPVRERAMRPALLLAPLLPMVLAFNMPPSPTLLGQCLTLGCWGSVMVAAGIGGQRSGRPDRVVDWPLQLAVACILAGAVAAWWLGDWPSPIALSTCPVLIACAFVIRTAARAHPDRFLREHGMALFLSGVVIAGMINACIGLVQVAMPAWPDGDWIARSSAAGRAVGNLRQPNHLSTLLLWSLIAVAGLSAMGRIRGVPAIAAGAVLLFATVLTGSRTGILGTFLLSAWGLLDRRLPRWTRTLLALSPVLYAALWFGAAQWAHATGHAFAGEGRMALGGNDVSSSRFAIWSNALKLIAREPWTGVGFGEFNVAWTLSQFPDRPTAFFDHTHNLPLQLLVELGIPLGTLVFGLLLFALLQAWRRSWAIEDEVGAARRTAFMMVLMVGLHSLLEYPLWYAYFLLPTAFAWGVALRHQEHREPVNRSNEVARNPGLTSIAALAAAGLAFIFGAAAAALDYSRVAAIYDPPPHADALEARIAHGQRSPLFGHHADYAAATAFGAPKAPLSASQKLAFRRAPHQLLDVRLMIAWSQALASQGDLDKARWLAARIREFHNSGADEYFAPCKDPVQAKQAFQCQPPTREVHWREFTQR